MLNRFASACLLVLSIILSCSFGSSQPSGIPKLSWTSSTKVSPVLSIYGTPFGAPSVTYYSSTGIILTYLSTTTNPGDTIYYTTNTGSGGAWVSPKVIPYQSLGPFSSSKYGYGGAGATFANGKAYLAWTTANNNNIGYEHFVYITYSGSFNNPTEIPSGSRYMVGMGADIYGDVFTIHNGNEGSGCTVTTIYPNTTVGNGNCAASTNFAGGGDTAYFNSINAELFVYVGSDGYIYYFASSVATKTTFKVDTDSSLSLVDYSFQTDEETLILFYKYNGALYYIYFDANLVTYPSDASVGYPAGPSNAQYTVPVGGAAVSVASGTKIITLYFQQNVGGQSVIYQGVGTPLL